jgi:hypothetical protein
MDKEVALINRINPNDQTPNGNKTIPNIQIPKEF